MSWIVFAYFYNTHIAFPGQQACVSEEVWPSSSGRPSEFSVSRRFFRLPSVFFSAPRDGRRSAQPSTWSAADRRNERAGHPGDLLDGRRYDRHGAVMSSVLGSGCRVAGWPQRRWRSLRMRARSRRWAARTSGWRALALRQRRYGAGGGSARVVRVVRAGDHEGA